MMQIRIRFNTDKDKLDSSLPAWRVIVDGVEYLAEKITLKTDSWTSMDEVSPGRWKWHISAAGTIEWDASHKECTIVPLT